MKNHVTTIVGLLGIVAVIAGAIVLPLQIRATAFVLLGVLAAARWVIRDGNKSKHVGFDGGSWGFRGYLIDSPFDQQTTAKFLVRLSHMVAMAIDNGTLPDGTAVPSPTAEQPEAERASGSDATTDHTTETLQPAATPSVEPAATPAQDKAAVLCSYGCGNPATRQFDSGDGGTVDACEACYTLLHSEPETTAAAGV